MHRWGSIWRAGTCLGAMVLAILGCDRGAATETPASRLEAAESHSGATEKRSKRMAAEREIDRAGVLIGHFELADAPVVDGDTIRVKGVHKSVRLLSIDTEERFEGSRDRIAAKKDFSAYLKRKRGNHERPQKPGTPMGEAATEFAKDFFEGAEEVRLERDIADEIRGHYGRPLAYAAVKKNGRWTSYNIECVRAGMSPYFTKYGYSHRFHKELTLAEAEAREARLGIWNPAAESYRDYDERKAWWNARADFIQSIEHEGSQRDDYVFLGRNDAMAKLERKLGSNVSVVSTVEGVEHFKGLARVNLDAGPNKLFPVIFFDKGVLRETGIEGYVQEPVMIQGKVERYEKGDYSTLQIVIDEPAQVRLPSLPEPG